MALTTVTLPGPTGTPVPLAAWGTPMTNNVNELIVDITPPISAWSTYTPVWGSTSAAPVLGNGTISGRFMQFGKLGFFDGVLTTGGTTTYGTGTYTFTLPVGWTAAAGINTLVGMGRVFDTSTTTRYVAAVTMSSTTLLTMGTHSTTTDVSGTVPVTLATGDVIRWRGVMELV